MCVCDVCTARPPSVIRDTLQAMSMMRASRCWLSVHAVVSQYLSLAELTWLGSAMMGVETVATLWQLVRTSKLDHTLCVVETFRQFVRSFKLGFPLEALYSLTGVKVLVRRCVTSGTFS